MAFMDGTAWKDRFLAKSRKKIKQAGRLLMALAVGGCVFAPHAVKAGQIYYFENPSSGNTISVNDYGYKSDRTPSSVNSIYFSGDGGGYSVTQPSYYGGMTFSETDSSNNSVTVNDGNLGAIWGGASPIGNANNNEVIVNNGTIIVAGGGYATGKGATGSASNNAVTINNGDLRTVYGGSGASSADGNIIIINGGTVDRVIGANATDGTVSNNTITINGGTINHILLSSDKDGSFNNTINIYNNPSISSMVGDALAIPGANHSHSGNTLNIHSKDLSVQSISYFDNINFYLPSSIVNGDTVLTVSGYTNLQGTAIRAGVEGNANLSSGDTVTLIKGGYIRTDNTTTYGTLSEGVSLDYDLTVEKADDTTIVARVGNVAPGAGANTAGSTSSSSSSSAGTTSASTSSSSPLKAQTSILPTPMLSSSVLALQGTDRLLEWLPPDDFGMEEESSSTEEKESEEVGKATSSGDFSIFANAGFTNLRTKTGSNSYIDSHSGGFDIGAARTLENSRGKLVFAPIIDYGTGSYDSYVNGMHGSGKTKYWAGGIIARQMNHNGFYYEASIRAGRTSVDFASNDFMQGTTPVHESYDVSAPVYAGHIRLGRLYQIDRSSQLHIYGIYAHNHQNGMTAQLATGETYRFGSVDSGRLRIGARLSWMKKKTQKFYSGIAYQYEFSNSASGTYRGYSTESSNLRGSSAMIELGWQVKPTENSPWMVDVGAVGWIGHQKGFSIQAKIKKAF